MNSMNSINNNPNNINFTSALTLNGFKVDKKKLNRVAEIFAEKTKKQNDEFELTNTRKGVCIYHLDNKNNEMERFYFVPREQWKALLTKSDNFVANKLVKLNNIDNKVNRAFVQGFKFLDNLIKKDKFQDPTKFESKFSDAFFDKLDADLEILLSKDKILKSFVIE